MATEGLTYTQYLYRIKNPQALQYMIDLENAVNAGEISQLQFSETVEALTGKKVQPCRAYNGDILGYNLVENSTVNASNAINSNTSTVSRGTIARPISSTVDAGGKTVIQGLRGVGTKVVTGAALVGTAAMCVSAGITLGKMIDGALYNANPDFWDSNGMSTLNPETWRTITAGDDSIGASLLNVLFGFDDDGNAQAYMDENALAYFAAYMNVKGAFATGEGVAQDPSITTMITQPIYVAPINGFTLRLTNGSIETLYLSNISSALDPVTTLYNGYVCFWQAGSTIKMGLVTSDFNTSSDLRTLICVNPETGRTETVISLNRAQTYNNVPLKWTTLTSIGWSFSPTQDVSINQGQNTDLNAATAYVINGAVITPAVEGIETQPGATTPDTSGWDTYANVLPSLQQQYPDLWNNAIQYPVVQPDGSVKTYNYVPVAMPDTFTRTGTQPESGTATQTETEIIPGTTPQELIDELTKILTNPMPRTETELNNPNPPENPTDTGDGSSPISAIPSGSASSLWKIYHPTQAQIDSFGSWLWSPDFVDQVLKIFNDPMQAIIGLHKVYATPVDAGTATIKVGYLDSEVPSAYIEQQYVEVDCGTVNLGEQFGNVFDYSPFTSVQLYLPFVGIVPLNVGDVMRGSISVKYGVDVLTGACLAMVSVSRDMNNAVLYQYSGNCAVQYPISSGSYMGIVSSIISIAGGITATIATGGGAAPIALGAAGAVMGAHTNIQHSGSFSGNSGAMGGKIPYLIITRPQTKVSDRFEEMEGYPTNEYVTVGECSGYVRARAAHVINVNATDEELNQINDLLISGIII